MAELGKPRQDMLRNMTEGRTTRGLLPTGRHLRAGISMFLGLFFGMTCQLEVWIGAFPVKRCLPALATLLACFIQGYIAANLSAQAKDKIFKSPQEVFEVARAAMQKNDPGALCIYLTDDTRDLLGGGLTLRLLPVRKAIASAGSPSDRLLMKKIDTILTRHGLSEPFLKKFEPLAATFARSDLESRLKSVQNLLEPVKDRDAFVSELISTWHQTVSSSSGVAGLIKKRSELTEVRIDGNHARGIVIHMHEGKRSSSVIHFMKIKECWKIDMTAELSKALNS